MRYKVACVVACLLLGVAAGSPAATHNHARAANSAEREEDGAFSPRDKKHMSSSNEHHSEFDHEAILGSHKAAEEFEHLPPGEAKRRLGILLTKMDLNSDKSITKQELKSWILRSFRMLSEEESADRFEDSDENEDGQVTWEEYLTDTFGIAENEITEDEDQQLVHDDKKMFDLADKNKDGSLDKKEFLLFSHPEEHPEMLPLILEQTLNEKDINKDGYIDFQEYIGDRGKSHDKEWLHSEKAKFDSDYDQDHDGRLNTAEILSWMVPSNDDIAEAEAAHLLEECDMDGDEAISYDEALDQHEVFVGSEATDYGDHLHNIHVFQDEL